MSELEYNVALIEHILEYYREFKDGEFVPIKECSIDFRSQGYNCPFKMAIILASDVDLAIDRLNKAKPGLWLGISVRFEDINLRHELKRLNKKQQIIIKHFLIGRAQDGVYPVLRDMEDILNYGYIKWRERARGHSSTISKQTAAAAVGT